MVEETGNGQDPNQENPFYGRVFRSLQYRNYRLFFTGQSISLVGTWMQRIAIPWLVYSLTGSAFLLGVVGFVSQIPTFLLAPFTGVLSDRWNRYHILVVTQALAMLQAFALALLFLIGVIKVGHIIFLGALLGCINAFEMPARQSFWVEIVERKEDLGNAIALNSSIVNSARLLGPAIAGMLIASLGEGICFLLNGISYLVVIASLLKIKVIPRKIAGKKAPILTELKEGFSYAFGFAPIRSLILLLAVMGLMGMPYTVLMPVFVKEILQGDSHIFGFLMGASGLGALTGAVYLASRKNAMGLGRIVPLSAGLFGCGLIAFCLSRTFMISFVFMVVIGLGMMLQVASSNTILQSIVEDDKRGRVMSFHTMAFMGTFPLGSLLAGKLATVFGVTTTLIIGGAACVLGAFIFAGRFSKLKKALLPDVGQTGYYF